MRSEVPVVVVFGGGRPMFECDYPDTGPPRSQTMCFTVSSGRLIFKFAYRDPRLPGFKSLCTTMFRWVIFKFEWRDSGHLGFKTLCVIEFSVGQFKI